MSVKTASRLIVAYPLNSNYAHQLFGQMFTKVVPYLDVVKDKSGIQTEDVVLFDGGTDVNPELYGEERHPFTQTSDLPRDACERTVFQKAQAAGAYCLGICRGAQFLTVVSGGKLIQHISGHGMCNHILKCADGTSMVANSDHHQAMWLGDTNSILLAHTKYDDTKTEAYCEYAKENPGDRVPEIVWFQDTNSLAIQGHPEWGNAGKAYRLHCMNLVKKHLLEREDVFPL